ncbi:hypothetical protein JRO89_XS05G0136900 [Xanthoceras sorbifolium]|uniref:Cysteine-rich transmembrane domain-containing protein n=1 Tax=Xanthoceras sorbifolium TaxID=99658 RepID=A0ABQ8I1S7_9ROSI|nr:hypothetical protein JRO89_XS05G0136900 [Xanthoceras sorbifolium]
MRCAWFRITKTRTGRKKEFSPDTTEKGSRKDRSSFIDGCLFALCCCGLFDACCVAAKLMINPDSVYKWPDKRNEHGAKETGKTEDSKKKRRGAFSKDALLLYSAVGYVLLAHISSLTADKKSCSAVYAKPRKLQTFSSTVTFNLIENMCLKCIECFEFEIYWPLLALESHCRENTISHQQN